MPTKGDTIMKDTFKNKKLSDKDIEKVSGGGNKHHHGTWIVFCISGDYEEELNSYEETTKSLLRRNFTCKKCGGTLKAKPNY